MDLGLAYITTGDCQATWGLEKKDAKGVHVPFNGLNSLTKQGR